MSDNGFTVKWPPGDSLGAAALKRISGNQPVASKVILGPQARFAHQQAERARSQVGSAKRKA